MFGNLPLRLLQGCTLLEKLGTSMIGKVKGKRRFLLTRRKNGSRARRHLVLRTVIDPSTRQTQWQRGKSAREHSRIPWLHSFHRTSSAWLLCSRKARSEKRGHIPTGVETPHSAVAGDRIPGHDIAISFQLSTMPSRNSAVCRQGNQALTVNLICGSLALPGLRHF